MADQGSSEDIKEEKGVAHIKSEFVLDKCKLSFDNGNGAENNTALTGSAHDATAEGPPNKSEKKKFRGQNKARPLPYKVNREVILCHTLVDLVEGESPEPCSNTRCQNMHDVKAFMAIRPPDIGTTCYNFQVRGRCPRGLTCRFGGGHISEDGFNKVNKEVWDKFCSRSKPPTLNSLSKELQVALRKRSYNFQKSEKILEETKKLSENSSRGLKRSVEGKVKIGSGDDISSKTACLSDDSNKMPDGKNESVTIKAEVKEEYIESETGINVEVDAHGRTCLGNIGPVSDEDLIRLKPLEKKKIDWSGKILLSPLTTVGNLPFRRICKEYGVDVTCGEMAMAASILQGHPQEWALVKRHESEDIFGVQLCGNNPWLMTRSAQVLQENTEVDFIDINMGCPIDLVYREGGGSGLLHRDRIMHSIIECMNNVMTIPLTVKTRTGISMGKNIAHNFMPLFRDLDVALITVHGRSREQRYTRSADWEYINECAKAAQPVPVFGNGDILSYEDYKHVMESFNNISGVMVGRGALIKPWIFTEIKEKRLWDISSSERFEILKKYVNYGLEHWGSDTKGVESTRRFLLEWLSFLHRYIPVGLLERPPQKINDRPPPFRGRDDLETLMASPNCAHWVEISEMLLGRVPDGFHFLPKHKANAWK